MTNTETPSYLLTEAYAIVKGAPIVPTVEHLKALHEQLHPKPEEEPCRSKPSSV